MGQAAVDRNAVLTALGQRGMTLKQWCESHGYGYRNASNVLRGVSRAHFGIGREIADRLNAIVRGEA